MVYRALLSFRSRVLQFFLALPQISSLHPHTESAAALTLNCTSTRSPAMTVVWRKDGASLANSSSYMTTQILRDGVSATYDNILDINAAPSDVIGVYSCTVQDSLGRNSQTAIFQIDGMMV